MAILPWQESHDGNFSKAFVGACLATHEIAELSRPLHVPQSIDERRGEVDFGISFEIRKTLIDIVLTIYEDARSVILKSDDENQSPLLAFECHSTHKRINTKDGSREPLLLVSYASSPSMEKAQIFLRDEEVQIITCSDDVVLQFSQLFNSVFTKSGLIDFASGLVLKEGFLEPIYPTPSYFEEGNGAIKEEICNKIETSKQNYLDFIRFIFLVILFLVIIIILYLQYPLSVPFQNNTQDFFSIPGNVIQYFRNNWDTSNRVEYILRMTELLDSLNAFFWRMTEIMARFHHLF